MSRIVQIAQHADDLDRAAAFYEQLLGQPPTARFDPPGLLFFTLGGTRLLLEQGAPSATIYLEVEDARASIVRAIRDLEATGAITVQRGDEDAYVE